MPRLDRLSALLNGLSAQVDIRHAGTLDSTLKIAPSDDGQLDLHLVLAGGLCFESGNETRLLEAPGALLIQSRCSYQLRSAPGSAANVLSARLALSGPAGKLLLDSFAQPVFLQLTEGSDDLVHLMALVKVELSHPRCGHGALLARAGDIMLITILRHIIARPGLGSGLLAALADPRIAQLVVALHEYPAHAWTLESMAETAGMSRTAFAATFRKRMGMTPGVYLGRLRLGIAEQMVTAGSGLKRAAIAAGYASTATLSRALSRHRHDTHDA